MPKPFSDRSGSGMHVNFSLVRDGKNIIHAADGLHDPISEQFVEGVLRHFPVRRIDFDKRARRAKVEISLCGESKTITLSTEGGEDESS